MHTSHLSKLFIADLC